MAENPTQQKKDSLSQTYKKNTEAHAKVYDLNQRTMKALETLAFLHSTFEAAGKDLNKADELLDKDFQEMQEAILKAKEAPAIRQHRTGAGLQSSGMLVEPL